MRVVGTALAVLLGLVSVAARADTITTFTVSGTTFHGPFDGTLTVDTTIGVITGSYIVLHSTVEPTSPITEVEPGTENSYYDYGDFEQVFLSSPDRLTELYLRLSLDSLDPSVSPPYLVGFRGASICNPFDCQEPINSSAFFLPDDDYVDVDDGYVGGPTSSVTTTPELSSALLCGSGVLAMMVFAARRRLT